MKKALNFEFSIQKVPFPFVGEGGKLIRDMDTIDIRKNNDQHQV